MPCNMLRSGSPSLAEGGKPLVGDFGNRKGPLMAGRTQSAGQADKRVYIAFRPPGLDTYFHRV